MNYIETPDGVKRPFRFRVSALSEMAALLEVKTLKEVAEILQEVPVDKIAPFVEIGLRHGAKKDKAPVNFTMDDVVDWVDEDFGIFVRAMEIASEDMQMSFDPGNAKRAKGRK